MAGKILYSATFLALVPAALIAWAVFLARVITLPVIQASSLGASLAAIGALLVVVGMRDLWVYGGGLPMNVDPPTQYVARGTYRVLPHPIYTGFSVLCIGVSILAGSASGLWLVSPVVMLACAAIVVGYEHHDLRSRFGPIEGTVLPPSASSSPSLSERLRGCLLVVFPWTILCIAARFRPTPYRSLLLLDSTALVLFLLVPLLAPTRRALINRLQAVYKLSTIDGQRIIGHHRSTMTFERTQVGDKIVLHAGGRLDAENAVQFERQCESCIADGCTMLVVDLADLAYVSSMGLRSVVVMAKKLRDKGGDLRLCRMTGLVRQVFEITRLNQIFPPHDSVESALTEG